MPIKNLKESIKGNVSITKEAVGGIKDTARQKLLDSINNLNSILPLIAETGYILKEMNVEVSIPPGVSLAFHKTKEISKDKIAKILKENKDKEMLKMIVNALVSADELHKKIALGKLKYRGLNLELGLPPKVVIKFAG
jgi:hypothetical protein